MSALGMRSSPPLYGAQPFHLSGSAPDSSINHGDAIRYWSSVSPTVNGMLGGYPQVSRIDLQGSRIFTGKLLRARRGVQKRAEDPEVDSRTVRQNGDEAVADTESKQRTTRSKRRVEEESPHGIDTRVHDDNHLLARAVDCGAGIGRITHGLLLSLAAVVDIVEPVEQFTTEIATGELFAPFRTSASTTITTAPSTTASASTSQLGDIYTIGLESWTPATKTYDLIWNQWCLGQLTDAQVVAYLKRCGQGLIPGGWVIVKENLSTHGEGQDVFDEVDSSVTRSQAKWEKIFKESGMKTVATEVQKGFPKELGLYPVRSWALQPGKG